MASKQTQIRTQLQNKIFTPYGKTVTLYTPSSTTSYDEYGDRDVTTSYDDDDLVIVDYDIIDPSKTHEMWGDLQVGDRMAIAAYDADVGVDYYIKIGSTNYKIVDIENPSLPDVVVKIIRLAKTNDTLNIDVTIDNFVFIDGNNFTFIDDNNFTFID